MDALGKFGEHSGSYSCSRLSPRDWATLTLLSCSPNFPRASITRYTHAKHEPILNFASLMSKAPEQQQVKDFTSWPVSWPAQINWAVSIVFELIFTWTDYSIRFYFQMPTSLLLLNTGIAKFLRWQAVASNSCRNANRRILKASHMS